MEVVGGRLLFISGQIPEDASGTVSEGFEAQCRQVWQNILAVLDATGMTAVHLIKVTTFLTDRNQADLNGEIRREVLGEHAPALTVMVAQTLNPAWLLEIKATAHQPA